MMNLDILFPWMAVDDSYLLVLQIEIADEEKFIQTHTRKYRQHGNRTLEYQHLQQIQELRVHKQATDSEVQLPWGVLMNLE